MPKQHFSSSLELDEDCVRELSSLKKTIVRFLKEKLGASTQTVFIETSITEKGESHMLIDAVGVPEVEEIPLVDLELYFRKTLLEADSKWNLSTTAKQVIDTKPWRGNVQKCMPSRG